MSGQALGPGPRTRVRRSSEKASYGEEDVFAIIDEARFCHVAAVVNSKPVALPTLHAREGRTLYLHGSPSNEVMKALVRDREAFVTVTIFDGLRLARSGFESSIAYRSAVVAGVAREVLDVGEKRKVLDLFVERVLPGRASEVRPIVAQELRRTMVVAVSIDEASAKISFGPTGDAEQDASLPIWAGYVPVRLVFETPVPDTNGAMASGRVEIPASIRRLMDEP